ncbi:homing endonuclease associated repeat-containing protein [Natrinema caseinilyticum]|uniref:homing endonuclease associated repeat-containing protein n=1 Tax=Natrinema caseinilyticum TaxID=2961570 RepID=UPI0020C5B101|nr:hypothetical protein [Natrinema caseinilyticum]
MSEEIIQEIDELLDEELPGKPEEGSHEASEEQKEELIRLLQYSEEKLGHSPSLREFNSLNLETSGYIIEDLFGSWNKAKREAGLEIYERGEGRSPTTPINEAYFERINTSEKAYWLGTLLGASTLNSNPSQQLSLGRVRSKEFFVKEFSRAVESEYAVTVSSTTRQGKQDKEQVQTCISNPTFIENLVSAGYPGLDETESDFPKLKSEYRAPFVRGYLESSGYFSHGWQVTEDSDDRAKTLQEWFDEFGAKRPTIGESDGKSVVRVSNVFDIRAVFETCWPAGSDTSPSYTPYPEKIVQYLQTEYPYPENVEYLSG